MAPTLSPDVVGYLGPPTNAEDQYTYPNQPVDGSEDTSGNDRDYNSQHSKVEDDEGYESSPPAGDLLDDESFTGARSLFSAASKDGVNKTLERRADWDDYGKYTTAWKDSLDTPHGGNFKERPQPWTEAEMIFALGEKDKNGKPMKEPATYARCVKDLSISLRDCEINGEPGSVYADKLVQSFRDVAQSHNRRDRELALERVRDTNEEIGESGCPLPKLCQRTINRESAYLRRPNDKADPALDVYWGSYDVDGELHDLRIPKKKMNAARRVGKNFGKSLQSLDPLNCTIGNDTAPVFVELTRAQLRDIDGDWYNSGPTLQSFNTSVNEAKTAYCPEWKQQKKFVKLGAEAVERAYSTKMEEQQQSRYFHKSATDQLEGRQESMAAPSKFAGSLAGTAALAAVVANYMF